MHEMAIANSVLEALEKEAARFPGKRIAKAGLRIGELAGVDPESLRFCLEALARGTAWEALELELEFCPRRQRCEDCSEEFVVEAYELACPHCGEGRTAFAGGDELELAYLEVEDHEPCPAGTQSSERE
jgi:hydrogenase nickel incorporation protein HypA/HybF